MPKYPSPDEKKMWYTHTIGYYLAIKKNRALIHSTMCIYFEMFAK